MIKKNCDLKVFNFVKKIKFLKIRDFFSKNPRNFFFVLKCKQKEHVHNLNRRWKSLVNINLSMKRTEYIG